MEISVPYDNITFDASAKTITMNGYYSGVSREQIQLIKNLTTGDTLYNAMFPNKYNIAVSGGAITHNYDNSNHSDTDIIQVTVMLTESMGYNATTDALKTTEQAPMDQQVLDATLLNAVTIPGASTAVYVLDKTYKTFHVIATNVTTGATFTFQISADGVKWETVNTFADGGTSGSATQAISANGNYAFAVDPKVSVKYMRANITSLTDGTYTCYLQGRA